MKLRELAHARSGDKGDISNISVIAYRAADYEIIRAAVTPERVKRHLRGIVRGEVRRYDLPGLLALNFVLEGALGGGVTRSLALDAHGKCLGGLLWSSTFRKIPSGQGRSKPAETPLHTPSLAQRPAKTLLLAAWATTRAASWGSRRRSASICAAAAFTRAT